MGRQTGIIPIEATMDNMTFYKSKNDGMRVKKQSRIPKERINNDPSFDKLRKNIIEFTNAAKAGKLLRQAVNAVSLDVADSRAVSRLMTALMLAVKADATHPRGQRNVVSGDLHFLEGFSFNKNADVTAVLKVDLPHSINRVTGALTVNVPALDLRREIVAPKDATHFKLISAGTEIDFVNNVSKTENYAGDYIALGSNTSGAFNIVHQLPANSTLPLMLLVGVIFFTKLNTDYEPTGGLKYNALNIVEVSKI